MNTRMNTKRRYQSVWVRDEVNCDAMLECLVMSRGHSLPT